MDMQRMQEQDAMAIQLLALWAEDAMTLRQSAREKVLKAHPQATSIDGIAGWFIYKWAFGNFGGEKLAGPCSTENKAWASAAQNMRRGKS